MISGVPKWVQKGEFISVLGVHGAPWAPKSVFGPESCISRPPKVTPRSDNCLKKGAKVVEKVPPNLARRTARSGLNNVSSAVQQRAKAPSHLSASPGVMHKPVPFFHGNMIDH